MFTLLFGTVRVMNLLCILRLVKSQITHAKIMFMRMLLSLWFVSTLWKKLQY